jgi:hypothetical protein
LKNQYVGDVNDYLKYGVLRALQATRQDPLYVCWMLTPNDAGPDGAKLAYLRNPNEYRPADPDLFDGLSKLIEQRERSVAAVEAAGLLPRASYFSELIPDGAGERTDVIRRLALARPDAALIFFDPDNGLEVKSYPRGKVRSSKYVFWDEIESIVDRASSLVAYQHHPRPPGGLDAYVQRRLEELEDRLPGHSGFAVRGPQVVFLVAAREDEWAQFHAAAVDFCARWPGKLWVQDVQ